MPLIPLGKWVPSIAADAFIAPSADVMGRVEIGPLASVWYQVVLRGDIEPIRIGAVSNVQDGSVLHTDHDLPCVLGNWVTVGHQACIHGARVGDGCLIGMGATLLTGAVIGPGSIVAAGALVPEGKEVPSGVLVMGSPFKIKRELTEKEREGIKRHAERYVEYAKQHGQWLAAQEQGSQAGEPPQRLTHSDA